MKGRQQGETVLSEPTTTRQSSSATEASIPGECQSVERGNTAGRSQKKLQPSKQKPICRFYMSSSCKYGARCRYYHPKPSLQPQSNPAKKSEKKKEKRASDERSTSDVAESRRTPSDLNLGMFMKPVKLRPPVRRPEPANKTPVDLLKVRV